MPIPLTDSEKGSSWKRRLGAERGCSPSAIGHALGTLTRQCLSLGGRTALGPGDATCGRMELSARLKNRISPIAADSSVQRRPDAELPRAETRVVIIFWSGLVQIAAEKLCRPELRTSCRKILMLWKALESSGTGRKESDPPSPGASAAAWLPPSLKLWRTGWRDKRARQAPPYARCVFGAIYCELVRIGDNC